MLHTEIQPARVFCSYSHFDSEFTRELEGHLYSLIRQELIILWYDRRIAPGSNWKEEIPKELDEADIILLLISSFFISSDYCYHIEMGRALQRHKEGSAVVIPVFIRAAHYDGLPFADLQGLPPDGRSVSEYENRDKAWVIVVEEVNRTLKNLNKQRRSQATPRTIISTVEKETYEANTYLRHLAAFNRRRRFSFGEPVAAEINGQIEPLKESLEIWAKARLRPLLLLVGEPNGGTTLAFRRLAATLAQGVLAEDHSSPQPIFVPFHSLQTEGGIAALSKAVPEAQGVLDRLNDGRNTILLFNGIDEVTLGEVEKGLDVLIKILEDLPVNVGVAVSCGTQLAPNLIAGLKKHRYQPLMCRIVEPEMRRTNHYFPPGCVMFDADGLDLQTVQQEILEISTEGHSNPTEAFTKYFSLVMQSIQERDKRVRAMPADVLWSFLTNLAREMFPSLTTDISRVHIDDAWTSMRFDVINGFVASGLLTIDARESISFSHVSFFEFFFARLLFEELSSWHSQHLSRSNLIYSYNINRFLVPMLLQAPPIKLTARARRSLKGFQKTAVSTGYILLTRPIQRNDFTNFVEDTGWRRQTGFGHWTRFTDSTGNLTASDGPIIPEQDFMTWSGAPDDFAVSLSWYDAFQFARWVGGSLPDQMALSTLVDDPSPEFEWTSSWSSEPESLIAVKNIRAGRVHGVNPDVRSSRIGFRVQLVSENR